MSILDDKLEKIIADSGIYFYKTEIENELKKEDESMDIYEAARIMWENLSDDANIAIYGLGLDSHYLFDSVDLTKKNVVCMIDNNPELTTFKGYPVIRNKDIPANKIDIVLITSSLYGAEMKLAVEEVSINCKIMDMWDELDVIGYLRSRYPWMPQKRMILLNEAILSYNTNHDYRYLLYAIGSYLALKDLKYALVFIDIYINSNYPNTDKLLDLNMNLLNLLDEIKQKLASKINSHSLVLIADGMCADDISPETTPFLHSLGENNIYCSNAYSHMLWTSTSIMTIFKQKSYIDNHLYKNPLLTGTEPLFEYLSKNNIDFAYYCPFVKFIFKNLSEEFHYSQNGCADTMWHYLCSAFENDKKALYFLHFGETHAPDLCLYHVNRINSNMNTYSDCVKYIDLQTKFLFDLLPQSTKLLFCSDHGSFRGCSTCQLPLGDNNKRCRIPYVICDRKTHSGKDERLVSHLDTVDILLNLVNDKSAFENINNRVLVEINEEFYYEETYLIKFARQHNGSKAIRASKSFISDKDQYIIFCDGEEQHFFLKDDEKNLSDDTGHADRINWFRENVNTKFPDWSDDNGRYDITRKYFDIDKKKGV